ncbi:MAG: hypothetical protein RLZZ551_1305, partial [Actinomycetota bacterium]
MSNGLSANMSLDEFTAAARAFLDANAERREAEKTFVWGEGSDKVNVFEERTREQELVLLEEAKEWRRKKFDAGFGWVGGPAEYGGSALPAAFDRAFARLEGEYKIPNQSFFSIGLGMVAPTILAHASTLAKDAYLTKMWRADIVGCQLFSEPGAG